MTRLKRNLTMQVIKEERMWDGGLQSERASCMVFLQSTCSLCVT